MTQKAPTGWRSIARYFAWASLLCLVLATLLCAANYILLTVPVSRRLAADQRNSVLQLSVHCRYYADCRILMLDLRGDASNAAPMDLLRATFQSSGELQKSGRHFSTVVFARNGEGIYEMSGDDFSQIGRLFEAKENPIYLTRTLPEKLVNVDGTAAFGTWTGGMLGVLGKQMEDVNRFAVNWSTARLTIEPNGERVRP